MPRVLTKYLSYQQIGSRSALIDRLYSVTELHFMDYRSALHNTGNYRPYSIVYMHRLPGSSFFNLSYVLLCGIKQYIINFRWPPKISHSTLATEMSNHIVLMTYLLTSAAEASTPFSQSQKRQSYILINLFFDVLLMLRSVSEMHF